MIDLVRVRQGREKLAILAQKYPEIRGARSAANLNQWEKTLKMEYEKKCKYILCGKAFTAGRKDKEFCSDAHRTAANKLRDNEPSDLAKLLSRAVEFDAQYHGHPSNLEIKRARDGAFRAAYDALAAELDLAPLLTSAVMVDPAAIMQRLDANRCPDHPHEHRDFCGSCRSAPVLREKLRAYMQTGMSQSRLAKLAGVSQSTISLFLAEKTDGGEDFRRAILDVVTQDHGMDKR
jgi:hypothetical protein